MLRLIDKIRRIPSLSLRHIGFCLNGLRFGFLFVRARSFKIPQRVRIAGKFVPIRFPLEHGVLVDFFVCFIRDEYGLRQGLSDIRSILDIGANLGFFSMAARSNYPKATIHAYEPNARILPFLRDNTSKLDIGIFSEAVGGESGYVSMVDSGDSNLARSTAASDGTVPQVSLATAVERLGNSVDLLKLDCEGAEWDMFRITEPWQHIRNIRMEYHLFHGETAQQVEQNLNRLGFEVTLRKPAVDCGTVWARRAN